MATCQQHMTTDKEKVKSLEAIFPNDQITEQKSALFVKKLLAVAISNITYLRNIFPEHAFGDKCLEDLNLKILRDESSCPGACQVIKWVKGCFDALDKKYIYSDPNSPETVIESYMFKFSYNNDGAVDIFRNNKKISSAYSADETKKATIRLLRTLIILTNTLTSLPDNVMMTMKLFYNDEVTPPEYEPPGFKASTDSNFIFKDETTNIAIGEVSSLFHSVKMRLKTDSKQFEMAEEPVDNTTDNMPISNEGLDSEGPGNNHPIEINSENASTATTDEEGKANHAKYNTSNPETQCPASPSKADKDGDEFAVRCPCGCNEDDGLMVMCSNCKFWQHGVCFLITSDEKAPENHICDLCAKPEDPVLMATDPQLYGMSSIAVQATCLWRRTLMASLEFRRVVAPHLASRLGIENNVAQGLINRMEKEGFLVKSNKSNRLGKTVNKSKIQEEGIPRYLRTPMKLHSGPTPLPDQDDIEMAVDTLIEDTNKIKLQGNGHTKKSSLQETTPAAVEKGRKKSKKRVYSRTVNDEFEVANSQEICEGGPKKKASIVSKDIIV